MHTHKMCDTWLLATRGAAGVAFKTLIQRDTIMSKFIDKYHFTLNLKPTVVVNV